MSIKKYFNRLFGKRKLSWSSKKHYSNYVFENFISAGDRQNVSKIFKIGSYRADGKYLTKIKDILERGKYDKICSLDKDDLYVVDESGEFEMPYGDAASVYLIQWINDNFQLIVEFKKAPELPKITPYEKSTLFNKVISLPKLKIPCKKQVFPYD